MIAGTVCAFSGDYSPETCAFILAALGQRAIIVPLGSGEDGRQSELLSIAGATHLYTFDDADRVTVARFGFEAGALVRQFRANGNAGLVIFSSGSTGAPKGILHDFERLLIRYLSPRPAYRTLLFMPIDHFGGINTLFGAIAHDGVGVIPADRSPSAIAGLIDTQCVELVPVTPTFLRLLLLSGAGRNRILPSVRLVSYGSEVMPADTLQKLAHIFPNARFQQTYGLSELGVLRSQSRGQDSLWMRVGGEGFSTRIVDGVLQIKSDYAMIGYLNEPSPFDHEGWMDTQDVVEQEGEWIRVLGRRSDIINVGGLKVFPTEVEDVLLSADNVADATVHAEPNPILGSIVVADVVLERDEPYVDLRRRLRAFCRGRLTSYKVPMRFTVRPKETGPAALKKARRSATADARTSTPPQ